MLDENLGCLAEGTEPFADCGSGTGSCAETPSANADDSSTVRKTANSSARRNGPTTTSPTVQSMGIEILKGLPQEMNSEECIQTIAAPRCNCGRHGIFFCHSEKAYI
ncbi:MAG: hypothetical protein ACRDIB_17730, partial [Ardenticatenaceae bacterium]